MQGNGDINTGRKTPVHLLIDHRERASRLVHELYSCSDYIAWKFEQLRCGDYLVENKFLIERKTYSDFLNSIKDGHLFRQAYVLSCGNYRPAVIVEGETGMKRTSNISRPAVLGALIHLKLIIGIPVFRTRNAIETLRLFYYLGQQLSKHDFQIRTASPAVHIPGIQLNHKQRQKVKLLQMVPGLGSKKAMALLQRFKSIKSIACASKDDLAAVSGIGNKLAESIWAVFCEDY